MIIKRLLLLTLLVLINLLILQIRLRPHADLFAGLLLGAGIGIHITAFVEYGYGWVFADTQSWDDALIHPDLGHGYPRKEGR